MSKTQVSITSCNVYKWKKGNEWVGMDKFVIKIPRAAQFKEKVRPLRIIAETATTPKSWRIMQNSCAYNIIYLAVGHAKNSHVKTQFIQVKAGCKLDWTGYVISLHKFK